MDAALCAFDADGVLTHWNREAERILGWTAAEAVGRHGLAEAIDVHVVVARALHLGETHVPAPTPTRSWTAACC